MEKTVAMLMYYAKYHLGLKARDEIYTKNLIMEKLGLNAVYDGEIDKAAIEKMTVPDYFTEKLSKYALSKKLCDEAYVPNFVCGIFGLITPPPSNVEEKFRSLYEKDKAAAFSYLFDLSIKSDYVKKTAVDKNIVWRASFPENYLEITINLSKPEKDNKDIAKLLTAPQSSSYPKCALCAENEGFCGSATKPPRHNIRTIDLTLGGEAWFMQYSPYQYYNEHCIVINKAHVNMKVDGKTFVKLFDFTDFYPSYFVGSNAPLSIVGGSILNHEHYQGGGHLMPLHFAKPKKCYRKSGFENVEFSVTDWYNSVVHIKGSREDVERAGEYVLTKYLEYSDESVGLIAKTDEEHNAVTPIARKENGKYILDLILRNNRCDEDHPDGIFHAHKEYHNIKKEGIGLIEAMGLFILPARLLRQMKEVEKYLTGKESYAFEKLSDDMKVHSGMIDRLIFENGTNNSAATARKKIEEYINSTCKNILINTAVFKPDEKGFAAFDKFMKTCGFEDKV